MYVPPNLNGMNGFEPWVGFKLQPFNKANEVCLPSVWNATGDFFLVHVPGSDHVSCWPREVHGARVAQIEQTDLTAYDTEMRREFIAEREANLVSVVEEGWLEIPIEMLEDLGIAEGSDAIGVLGMQDHFEIWKPETFEETVSKIDVSPLFEQ